MIPDEVKRWVAESRRAQGLSPTVTNPLVLAAVARIVVRSMVAGGDAA